MENNKNRFEVIFKDGSDYVEGGGREIIVDKETGVHYLLWHRGSYGGITPLLDTEGRVVVAKPE